MLDKIPLTRAITYLVILGVIPILIVLFNFYSSNQELNRIELQIEEAQALLLTKERQQALNLAVIEEYSNMDNFYLEKNLDPLILLEREQKDLERLLANPNFAGNPEVIRRLEFLKKNNKMTLIQAGSKSTPQFVEIAENLVQPVEVDVSDIKKILSIIEGIDIPPYHPGPNRPQILTLDFTLDKKNIKEENEVYQLNLRVLRREYL